MRKYLILTMLLFSLSLLTAGDYIIGSGTSNQYYVPFYGGNNYSWSKFFFTADELLDAGMTGSVEISKIGFQLVSNTFNNYITNDQRIYIHEFYDENYPSSPQYVNCNVSVKTSNWITENFKCPSPMVSKPKTPSVTDFLSYFIIYGYAQKLGTCFVPVNVHVNQYSDRI